MAPPVNRVIMIAIALMVIAVIVPLAIGMIAVMDEVLITVPFNLTGLNETQLPLKSVVDPSLIVLLTVLLPILAVIGLIMYFLPRKS
ncbi:His1-like major capsid protein [Lokiarchaeota virus WyrdV1]|nr:His1-like major capsid protein [Lokiarchaeota virus WyrdV1]